MTGKKCSTCGVIKLHAGFWACPGKPDGLQNECKACKRLRQRVDRGNADIWRVTRKSLTSQLLTVHRMLKTSQGLLEIILRKMQEQKADIHRQALLEAQAKHEEPGPAHLGESQAS